MFHLWLFPNLVDVDQTVAVMFIGMLIGIVIAGAVMAYFSRKR
jgi:hypothetical protein